MASLVGDAAPASVENVARSCESAHDSGTQALMAPVVQKRKNVSHKVKEKIVRDALVKSIGGHIEWRIPSGAIDVFTTNEVLEVKHYKQWKSGIGQVISYGAHYPLHKKRLHLFANRGEKALKYFEMATKICSTQGIYVTFEEVFHGSMNMGAHVFHGADVFFGDAAGGTTVSLVKRENAALESGTAPVAGAAVTLVAGAAANAAAGVGPAPVAGAAATWCWTRCR